MLEQDIWLVHSWALCVAQKETELSDGMQRDHCRSLIGRDMVTWFLVVDFQTPIFNCYIQYICFRVCVALVTTLSIWYRPWEPEDGRNIQDNNLPFLHKSDKAKDIPKFLPAAGAGILCWKRCPFETAKTNTLPSPGPDHLKYAATSDKIPLEQKLTFPTIWSRMELGEMKEEISYTLLACQSHLVDIFTWCRSDLVPLVLSCLEFASVESQVARLSRAILLYWCSFTLCVVVTATLVSSGNFPSWGRIGSHIYHHDRLNRPGWSWLSLVAGIL